jgi:predicted alpha/beta-hydrolase family hydrolase
MLFIKGTRDAFCRLELLQPALQGLGERATLHLIEGADHSFRLPKSVGRHESEVLAEIAGVLIRWMEPRHNPAG